MISKRVIRKTYIIRVQACCFPFFQDPDIALHGDHTIVVVRATAVGRNAVLAGDLKVIRLLCNSNLNISILSRGSEEKRIRICLQAWSNIQGNGYRK